MTESIRQKSSSECGGIALIFVMVIAAVSAVMMLVFLTNRDTSLKASKIASRTAISASVTKSAIETFLLAWRHNELAYIKAGSGCNRLNSFIVALREGSGCASVDITVLGIGMQSSDPFVGAGTYDYSVSGNGCKITEKSSTCSSYSSEFLELTKPGQMILNHSFHFSLANIYPSSQMAEINVRIRDQNQSTPTRMTFALRDNFVNLVHLDPVGRVVQERPDPLSRCPSNAWAPYLAYIGGTCRTFDILGSGTGLASYKNRYFGFRSQDGTFIDLAALSSGAAASSYIVKPNGVVDGAGKVFVSYPDPSDPANSLRNVDDVTLIDEQVYFVAGVSDSTKIGVVTPSATKFEFKTICPLGKAGWAQSNSGLAVAAWSEPLVAMPGDPISGTRYAKFFIKSDSGDLLTTFVVSDGVSNFECYTFKDPLLQQIEYRRTMGFDRSVPEKIYFLY